MDEYLLGESAHVDGLGDGRAVLKCEAWLLLRPPHHSLLIQAQGGLARETPRAGPAVGDQTGDDAVARLQACHAGADRGDDTGDLMPSGGGQGQAEVVVDEVQVRVAQAGGLHVHQDLPPHRVVDHHIMDLELAPDLHCERCAHNRSPFTRVDSCRLNMT